MCFSVHRGMAEEEQLRVLMMVCSDLVTRSKRKKLDFFTIGNVAVLTAFDVHAYALLVEQGKRNVR